MPRKRTRSHAAPDPASPLTGQDVAALMSAVDFSELQRAERRALMQQAAACAKRSPALFVALQRLAQEAIVRDDERELGGAARLATGTMDLSEGDEGPNRVYMLRDLDPQRNRLFSCRVEEAEKVAELEVDHEFSGALHRRAPPRLCPPRLCPPRTGRRPPQRPPARLTCPFPGAGHPYDKFGDDDGGATLMFLKCPGATRARRALSLADMDIDACVYYSIAPMVEEGVLTEPVLHETREMLAMKGAGLAVVHPHGWRMRMVGVFLV